MSQSEGTSNDPIQLKQTIIYLKAELNKYKKLKQPSSSLIDELHMEMDRLTNTYKELLHQNKKYEKRLRLYEQRIRSLEAQRKELLVDLERLQGTEQELRATNAQLFSLRNDQFSEVMKAIKGLETKVETAFSPSKGELSVAESKNVKLQLDLETAQNVNAKQSELISILEEYLQQLTED